MQLTDCQLQNGISPGQKIRPKSEVNNIISEQNKNKTETAVQNIIISEKTADKHVGN